MNPFFPPGAKPGWALLFIFALLFFPACGIEDYYYLYPIPPGNIQMETISRATIILPEINLGIPAQYDYFRFFTIYYRIYVSNVSETGRIQMAANVLSRINPYLSSDYFGIEPYLSSETRVNTSIGSLFRSRNYHALALAGVNIEQDVLNRDSRNKTLVIDFPQTPGGIPYMLLGSASYTLFRSNGGGLFNPQPDRLFTNSSPLYADGNLNNTVNADVAGQYGLSGPRYTYVSMYIVVTGIDPNLSPIYSTPTFIGIFRLPDPVN